MAQRRFHYDLAFERYLRGRAIPYVAVDEAKRAVTTTAQNEPVKLKSFDFVVYSRSGNNLLVDVKGRKHVGARSTRLDNWVTESDVESLVRWERIFGDGFRGVFVFLYWCQTPPPNPLFQETFEAVNRWYALLAITVGEYRAAMKLRSPSWRTVSMPSRRFTDTARPMRELL